ncbi:hypothetical protein [Streptomyces sp. NPDC059015]|uniref:hypothetical protein n=1 Tax=unclassified Streptomyces TaxID=2593676 RepID=UPI0036CE9E8C
MRRATTHRTFAGRLAADFPDVEVDGVLFVDDGRTLTSAGIAADATSVRTRSAATTARRRRPEPPG